MVKFPEAEARLFRGVFVCKNCKKKLRAPSQKILQKKIACRGCGGKAFRPVRKK
ncbi:MAG TPA: 50S ribosomal protein L40e [Candidatus Nanoarchaeia archaeon]|nr:50S ribosomal protein L40e [Candidatus Nanoarchaeia archaeon]